MPTMHRRQQWHQYSGPCNQGRIDCPCPSDCLVPDDDPRNAKPLHRYVSDLWRGMSDGARFVFWLLMAIQLVAAAWHVAARLPALT